MKLRLAGAAAALALGTTLLALIGAASLETATAQSGAQPVAQRAYGAHLIHIYPDTGINTMWAHCQTAAGGSNVALRPGESTQFKYAANGYPCQYFDGGTVDAGTQWWCRPAGSGQAVQLYWTGGWHPWPYSTWLECKSKNN